MSFNGPADVVRPFHDHYYNSAVWRDTFWLDTPVLKCPLDLWVYQELVTRIRPGLIIECGTWAGGTSRFLAHMLDLLGHGRVVTIDVLTDEDVSRHYREQMPWRDLSIRPPHPRVQQLIGSSADPAIVAEVRAIATRVKPVMAIVDSDHSEEHVRAELDAYGPLVTPGSYFIVEDTDILVDGPRAALEQWLLKHPDFEPDRSMEKFFLTFNPGGYLRRREAAS